MGKINVISTESSSHWYRSANRIAQAKVAGDCSPKPWKAKRTNPLSASSAIRPGDQKAVLPAKVLLHMMFRLGQCAEKKWPRLHGFDYLAKVITGVKFKDGIEVTDVDRFAA